MIPLCSGTILTVSSNFVALGESIDVKWRFHGKTGSIRQLAIKIQGTEHAEYRRGTSTYTDTEDFATLPIIDTTNSMDITSGMAAVTIPANTMHTFASDHNKIVWSLSIHGEIGFWPDVGESFEITVVPKPGAFG